LENLACGKAHRLQINISKTFGDNKLMTVTILPNPKVLTNNKWPPGVDPGGHHFAVLNVSINNKPIFFSEVVICNK